MQLFLAIAIAAMTTSASAWRVRFYARTGTSGGDNLDIRGSSSVPCTNIPGTTGDLSMRFLDAAPEDTITVFAETGCTGTASAVFNGTATVDNFNTVPGLLLPVKSFQIN